MCTIKNFFEGATGNFAESHTVGMKTLQIFAVRVMCVRTMDIFIHKNIKKLNLKYLLGMETTTYVGFEGNFMSRHIAVGRR